MLRLKPVLLTGLLAGIALLAVWFRTESPDELRAWLEPAPSAPARSIPPPSPPPPAPPIPAGRPCMAMTWGVRGQHLLGVWVGAIDGQTNAYSGDTPCSETRPLLCFKPGSHAAPEGLQLPPPIRWSGGEVALVPDVLGLEVRSLDRADAMCAAKFGDGWRMAEFHDAGAWGYGAVGELPRDARFWVAINDQRANLWSK